MATGPSGGAPAVLAAVVAHAWSQSEALFSDANGFAADANAAFGTVAPISAEVIASQYDFTPTDLSGSAPQAESIAMNTSYQMPAGSAPTVQPVAMDVSYQMPAGAAPVLQPVALDTSYVPPALPSLQIDDPDDAYAMYDATRQQIENMLTGTFLDFLGRFFPSGFFDAALAWCNRAITQGGTGVNPAVEQALFERDRARLVAEQVRAEQEAEALYANRRWPLPPGVLLAQRQAIALDTRNKLAERSRDIMIESWRMELENVKFAVGQVLDLRVKSIAAAGDYIRTLILGPQTAMQLATSLADLRTKFNQSMVALYSAEAAALEPRVRLAIADADLKMRGEEANQRSRMDLNRLLKEAGDTRSRLQVERAGIEMRGEEANQRSRTDFARLRKEAEDARSRIEIDRAGLAVNQVQANMRARLDSFIKQLDLLHGDNRLRVEVQEGFNRIAAQQAELAQRAATSNQQTALGVAQGRADVATRMAQMVGSAAGAALNGVNAGVSIQGNDSSSL